jgi:hypothetical protein
MSIWDSHSDVEGGRVVFIGWPGRYRLVRWLSKYCWEIMGSSCTGIRSRKRWGPQRVCYSEKTRQRVRPVWPVQAMAVRVDRIISATAELVTLDTDGTTIYTQGMWREIRGRLTVAQGSQQKQSGGERLCNWCRYLSLAGRCTLRGTQRVMEKPPDGHLWPTEDRGCGNWRNYISWRLRRY